MVKLIAFDWDDVFTLGSRKGYYKCYHETLLELGIELDPEEEHRRIQAKWGQPHREELRELLQENPELLDQACKIYEEKFFGDTFVSELTFVPGGIELLNRLDGKYKLAVVTGGHPVILKERVIPKFGVPQVFSQIVTAYELDDPTKAKPHPHMLEHILESQGAKPEETVYVGDARNDVLMAQAAKATPVAVLTGHLNRYQAEELGVKYIIPSVAELDEVLELLR